MTYTLEDMRGNVYHVDKSLYRMVKLLAAIQLMKIAIKHKSDVFLEAAKIALKDAESI